MAEDYAPLKRKYEDQPSGIELAKQRANGRVGVIVGKGGETIKYLQLQSGAKIQITRDIDADPNSSTRMVELMGTPDAIACLLRNSSMKFLLRLTGQAGSDEFVMKIPNNKVGLIIGKGGETIKNMQTSTGARIQVILLHLPLGDTSTERTLKIDGTPEQIEPAKQNLIILMFDQNRGKNNFGLVYCTIGDTNVNSFVVVPSACPGKGCSSAGVTQFYHEPVRKLVMAMCNLEHTLVHHPSITCLSNHMQAILPSNLVDIPPIGTSLLHHPHQQSTHGGGYDYYSQQPQQPQNPGGTAPPADGSAYNYSQPPSSGCNQSGQQGSAQDSYDAYNAQSHSGYGQPPTFDQQQGYGPATGYGSGSNPAQEGHTANYAARGDSAQAPSAQPTTVVQQGYPTNQQPSSNTVNYSLQGTPQPGYGVPPTSQAAYGNQPQPGYGTPQSQKPTGNSPVYGESQFPSAGGGYDQSAYPVQPPPSGYAQPESGSQRAPASGYGGAVQPGYGHQTYGAPQGGQPGYGQAPPSYSNSSFGAGYTHTLAYTGDGDGNAQAPHSAVAKASPKS
ncbi:Far upstream element-binding protein 2 [Glycine soja]